MLKSFAFSDIRDSLLTAKEKKLVDRAKADLATKKGNFVPIEEL